MLKKREIKKKRKQNKRDKRKAEKHKQNEKYEKRMNERQKKYYENYTICIKTMKNEWTTMDSYETHNDDSADSCVCAYKMAYNLIHLHAKTAMTFKSVELVLDDVLFCDCAFFSMKFFFIFIRCVAAILVP